MRILVVEDEKKTAAYVSKGLTENGADVETVGDGEGGLLKALAGSFDLILLDIMLPGRDGWSVLSELRQRGNHTPVLFLTAADAVEQRVRGLELGADDYLVKPFAFSELLARIRSVLRRAAQVMPQALCIADLELDLLRDRATRAGRRLDLTPKEFALLALLARRQGEVLTRTLLAEQIWDMKYAGDTNVVDVHVRRLRSKLDDPFPQKLLHTVRGVGYVLEDRA